MPRIVAIADSDSYLKWSSALLGQLPSEWHREQWVVRTPITPSRAQIAAATGDATLAPTGFATLMAALARCDADVVLLACTGPVVQAFVEYPLLRRRGRPVLMTGLPGISIPSTRRAVGYRSGVDLFVLHSERERAEFAARARSHDEDLEFVVARLPFLAGDVDGPPVPAVRPPGRGREIVFATQAKVPRLESERVAILQALAAAPSGLRPVVKVRALAGEQQTHHEAFSYAELWNREVASGRFDGSELTFRAGSMADALTDAAGFVTVSSTAALEALAAGVPTLILSDFGVSAEMINLVFEGSGLLGTLDDVRTGTFHSPDPAWLAENYFQPHNDWLERLTGLVEQRVRGPLPARRFRPLGRYRGRLRRQIRVLAPGWAPSAARSVAALQQSH